MKVCKFGGTSLANAGQIQKICRIVLDDPDRRIVVVSAPGKRYKEDTKVTDLLIACAKEFIDHGKIGCSFDRIVGRFQEIQEELDLPAAIVETIAQDLKDRLATDCSHQDRFLDILKAAGEDNCAKVTAEIFKKLGAEARYVSPKDAGLLLSDEFGNAQVLPESYDNLKTYLSSIPGIIVFPGFFGYTRSGDVATFPRGGSDITGAILAAAVKADLYENFTDVDSVFAANPNIVPNPRPITAMSYREMRELSYAGFAVFHDEAIFPAVRAKIPISIKNTNRPEAPGTQITPSREYVPGDAVGIAAKNGFCSIYIEKYLMNREVGFGRHLLRILEDEGLSFEHVPSGIDNISVVLSEKYLTGEIERRVIERIQAELKPDSVFVERGLALLMVVGEGMRHAVGAAARATRALGAAGVNIEMINQGSSEISMMFGIKSDDEQKAVHAIYEAFFTPEGGV